MSHLNPGQDEATDNEDREVDNPKSVLFKIATLYAEKLMSDLLLEVAGTEYPAHRLILCASSEVFQVMLMNREWSEWRESRIVLQETPLAALVFPHFLKYLYTGQIRLSCKTVLPVLSLADKYNVKDLVSLCQCYMLQNIAQSASRGQLISWMQYNVACGHDDVVRACLNFFKWNLEWLCTRNETELAELEGDTLVHLLQQSDLVLYNEMSLYQFVVRWLDKQRERFEVSDYVAEEKKQRWDTLVVTVFSHIRFPMMGPNQLARLLLFPLTQTYKAFFTERIAIAINYQSGQHERVANIQRTDIGRLLFTPRLYTEDTWGSMLAVDNFHGLPCYHTRTFIFSTGLSTTDVMGHQKDKVIEWTVDLYPKGVWFKKSLLIVWARTYDVPEVVLRTVRISITCQSCDMEQFDQDIRVKIGILVWGVQNGVEHICSVIERINRFSSQNRVLNIDDALDFDDLNTPLYTPSTSTSPGLVGSTSSRARSPSPASRGHPSSKQRCTRCLDNCDVSEPQHLLGPNRDQLKLQIVILPLNDYCHVGQS